MPTLFEKYGSIKNLSFAAIMSQNIKQRINIKLGITLFMFLEENKFQKG
jgi:hypothetical protein